MDPFSYKADLEAQALQEWIELIHKNLVRRMLRVLARSIRFLWRRGIRIIRAAVQASKQSRPAAARNWADKKQA